MTIVMKKEMTIVMRRVLSTKTIVSMDIVMIMMMMMMINIVIIYYNGIKWLNIKR